MNLCMPLYYSLSFTLIIKIVEYLGRCCELNYVAYVFSFSLLVSTLHCCEK